MFAVILGGNGEYAVKHRTGLLGVTLRPQPVGVALPQRIRTPQVASSSDGSLVQSLEPQ